MPIELWKRDPRPQRGREAQRESKRAGCAAESRGVLEDEEEEGVSELRQRGPVLTAILDSIPSWAMWLLFGTSALNAIAFILRVALAAVKGWE